MFYRILAKLLDYPSAELHAALADSRVYLNDLPAHERKVLADFIADCGRQDLLDWQASYVQTFDMVPDHALHLTHHVFGEDKNRGPALIDLSEFYRAYGLTLAANELPDYLPLMLEFADQLSETEAILFFNKWAKVLRQLALNLEKSASPYARLITLLEQRSLLAKAA